MQLKNIEKEENITKIYYELTFPIGWEELICILDAFIKNDFTKNDGKIYEVLVGFILESAGIDKTNELLKSNYNINECNFAKEENSWISIAGYSDIIEKNIKITLWNQLDKCLIEIEDESYIEKEGEHIYDKYVDKAEITGFIYYAKNENSNN